MYRVIISLSEGRIETGFNAINIELKQDDKTHWVDLTALIGAPELQELLTQWQFIYPSVLNLSEYPRMRSRSSVIFDEDVVTNISSQDLQSLNYHLNRAMNDWLASGDFGKVIGRIRTELDRQDRITIAIVSAQQNIWQLPWHYWDIFEHYPHAIEVFSKPRYQHVRNSQPQRNGRVNIFGLFGRDPRLELNPEFLNTLPQTNLQMLGVGDLTRPQGFIKKLGAKISQLFTTRTISKSDREIRSPSAYEIADTFQSAPWDIFIFNGHGDTIENNAIGLLEGVVYLDNDTPLEINKLSSEIASAVERSLQIAILNCCRGLGLADRLSDLNLPYIIVMREKIPDRVAQQFLADILTQYSRGDSFPAAFRAARTRLVLADGEFARFADWLPVLFHNPLSRDVTWQDLCQPAFSIPIPLRVVTACKYLSQPQHQIWTGIGLSLGMSLLALSLQFTPQLLNLENWTIDRVQFNQAARIAPNTSKLTIVNDDTSMSILGENNKNNAEPLAKQIDDLAARFKPLGWIIDTRFAHNSNLLDRADTISDCDRGKEPIDRLYHLPSELVCNRQSPTLQPYYQQLSQQKIRLNPYLLAKINSIDLSKIKHLPVDRIKALLIDKIVVIGDVADKESLDSIVNRDALAFDLITRSRESHQPLPLFTLWQDGSKLAWIFLCSALMAISTWQKKWRLFAILTIGVWMAIAGMLLIYAQEVPLVLSGIVMVIIHTAILSIKQIARRQVAR